MAAAACVPGLDVVLRWPVAIQDTTFESLAHIEPQASEILFASGLFHVEASDR